MILLCCAGVECWTTNVSFRADVGMCLSSCATRLAVPAGNGKLYALSTADGNCLGEVDCGGEVRAPPATDPWWGLWWVVSHGKQLLVIDPESLAVVARWVC